MSDHPYSALAIRNIALATDFSPWSERAIQPALFVAQQFRAVLHFLHTVRRSEFSFVPDMMVPLEELAERDYSDLISRLNAARSLENIEHRWWNLDGEVSGVFGDFVRNHRIDLLVLGTRGRSGISKLLLGSIAQEIFHYISCPALTIGPWSRVASKHPELKKVLFATDLSAESEAAIPYVLTTAETWQAEVHVLHVCSSANSGCQYSMDEFRGKMDAQLKGETHLPISYHLLPGEPSSTVLNFATENRVDLIVLGLDHDRSLYSGPSLSHAHEIMRQARCPVLSVRSAPGCVI